MCCEKAAFKGFKKIYIFLEDLQYGVKYKILAFFFFFDKCYVNYV